MDSTWVAQRKQHHLAQALKPEAFLPCQRDTIQRIARQWNRDGFTLSTQMAYARHARSLAKAIQKPFEDATRQDLERYIDDIASRCATSTVTGTKRFLKAFYKQLLAPEAAGHPPVVAWIRVTSKMNARKLPTDMLTTHEIQRLARATTHPRDQAIIIVLYESAARVGELISLRVGDIEFDEYGARATLRGKTGERKVRLIDSVPNLQAWLNLHPRRDEPDAPLWLSWGHQNYHEPIQYEGVRQLIQTATKQAGIKKRVHPHLFRHSRLTEMAKFMPESALKVAAGWTADSAMAKVYIHLSGDDVDKMILRNAGILQTKTQTHDEATQTRTCLRCKTKNAPTASYCAACSQPLDAKAVEELVEQRLELEKKIPLLLKLAEDPRIQRILAEAP